MSGVIFSHPIVSRKHGDLSLRLAPTEVDWSYELVTSETNTYAGQVIQLLSVNFKQFVISGRFGKESRSDYSRVQSRWVRNNSPSIHATSSYGPGLTQMTEWFKYYFAVASQGVDGDNYSESPITVSYKGSSSIGVGDDYKSELTWRVYPTSFPSYKIANDNFAPEWKVECAVEETPPSIHNAAKDEAISRLQYQPLYQPGSVWSDWTSTGKNPTPDELRKAAKEALTATETNIDHFYKLLPTYTESDILDMLQHGFSSPISTATKAPASKAKKKLKSGSPFADNAFTGFDGLLGGF